MPMPHFQGGGGIARILSKMRPVDRAFRQRFLGLPAALHDCTNRAMTGVARHEHRAEGAHTVCRNSPAKRVPSFAMRSRFGV